MHRLIVLSRTYQMSSVDHAENRRTDANNDLFWRFNRQRLEAEAIRDSLLAASGELDRTMGEAHPFPQPKNWVKFSQHNPFLDVYPTKRRSVYLMQQRIRKHPFLALFDGADANSSTYARGMSTTPLQALFMMNDPFVHKQSAKFAERLARDYSTDEQRIDAAYRIAFGRPPEADEAGKCKEFLSRYRERESWAGLARVLLSTNEFIFVD
jgi:hypothetical protein